MPVSTPDFTVNLNHDPETRAQRLQLMQLHIIYLPVIDTQNFFSKF